MNAYQTFTRKQASVIYANVKRGTLTMSKKNVSRMYNLVNVQARFYCGDDDDFVYMLCNAINAITDGAMDVAQNILNGEEWHKVSVPTGETITRPNRFSKTGYVTIKLKREEWKKF